MLVSSGAGSTGGEDISPAAVILWAATHFNLPVTCISRALGNPSILLLKIMCFRSFMKKCNSLVTLQGGISHKLHF